MEKQRILLVEDSPTLLKLARAIFETGGFAVITATDGLEALEILDKQNVALIITDILMPNMDGYSLCYKIRNDEKKKYIPIIIYSATYTSQSDEELALDTGADMFIRKPATMNFLLNAATELISKPVRSRLDAAPDQELSDVMRQYNSRLIEKLEQKNRELEDAHSELAKRERRFRALIENNYEAITLRNEEGNVIYHSPGAERIIGYSIEEANGLESGQMFHPEDMHLIAPQMKRALENPGMPIYGEHRVRHRDGHYIWLEGSVTNLLNDKDVNAVVGNFREVTERKAAAEKLKVANRLYAFVSAINQTIVHIKDQRTLFYEACRIAIDVGKFKIACLGIVNEADKTLELDAYANADGDSKLMDSISYQDNTVFTEVLLSGKYHIINDLLNHIEQRWRDYAVQRGVRSCVLLPIVVSGKATAIYMLFSAQVDFFDEQELKLLIEVAGDISFAVDVFRGEERRLQMEHDLMYSELRLRQAQTIAHVGSWELDFATGMGQWSEETCRIYGLTPTDNSHSYDKWLSFVHPDDREHVQKIVAEASENASGISFHHRIVRADGKVRYVLSQAEMDISENAMPGGMHGVVHDETEKREIALALEQSETNLRSIMDLIPQYIFVKDADGKYLFVNKSFAGLYGVAPAELTNKNIAETIPGYNDAVEYKEQDTEVLLTRIVKTIPEQIFTDSDGNTRTFYTIKVPYTEPGTNKKAVLGIAMDITDQKMAEKERSQMLADMMQRNNDLEQFSYIISHNLRSPIANILGLAELMTLPDLSKEDELEITNGVLSSVKRLDEITIDLNYILQVRQGINERKELVRFSALISNIKASIANIIRIEDVTINCDFSLAKELFTVKSYLHSILFNLISNSIKYRKPGVKPVIDIKSELEHGYLRLTFKDNGLGIDMVNRGKEVFRLYKRFHFHVEGKGIGLYMVKTQVEALGGKITVRSEENAGTEFRIEFNIR